MSVQESASPAPARHSSSLKREVGLIGLMWASVGSIIGSGWLFGAQEGLIAAGPAAIISWIVGGLMMMVLALIHAELGGMYPVSGGTARFPHYAFGGAAGASFGWFSWLQAATVAPIEVSAMITYAQHYSFAESWLNPSTKVLTTTGLIVAVPGPSAVETALVVSGLGAERYQFLGYLPRAAAALGALGAELSRWPHAAVAFESPQRITQSLLALAPVLGERPVAVCRELTKRFEEVVRGTPADVAARLRQPVRGEITLVFGPGASGAPDEDEGAAAEAVAELVAAGVGRRAAVDLVARLTGLPRNVLYRSSL